jgi:hypothetical protein
MLIAFSTATKFFTRARLDVTLIRTSPVVLYFNSPDLSLSSEFLCCPFAHTVTGAFLGIINGYLHWKCWWLFKDAVQIGIIGKGTVKWCGNCEWWIWKEQAVAYYSHILHSQEREKDQNLQPRYDSRPNQTRGHRAYGNTPTTIQ